jgi:hypothetical protein
MPAQSSCGPPGQASTPVELLSSPVLLVPSSLLLAAVLLDVLSPVLVESASLLEPSSVSPELVVVVVVVGATVLLDSEPAPVEPLSPASSAPAVHAQRIEAAARTLMRGVVMSL